MKCSKNLIPLILAGTTLAVIIFSGINPPAGTSVWCIEIIWSALYFAFLILTFPRVRFSNLAYALAAFWCILQAIGAHYSFENVPFFEGLFGWERNHFDRLAHFAIGLNALLICEYLFNKKIVNSASAAGTLGACVIIAVAGIWEIIEWLYATLDGGETGTAFLGSQGDIWDAQKDILCDTLGGICAAIIFKLKTRSREIVFGSHSGWLKNRHGKNKKRQHTKFANYL